MAEPIVFPDLTEATLVPLRVLRILYSAHGGAALFDKGECPYTPDQKALLIGLLDAGDGGGLDRKSFMDEGANEGLDRHDMLEHQIALALTDINNLDKATIKMEHKDKLAFLKAKPGLIERLLDLKGRNTDQRAVSEFMKRMYRFIDEELTTDQRTKLIRTLGDHTAT